MTSGTQRNVEHIQEAGADLSQSDVLGSGTICATTFHYAQGRRHIAALERTAAGDNEARLDLLRMDGGQNGVQSACAVAGSSNYRKLESMEVTLSPEQQARLARLARERGTDAQALAREAIERLLATTIGSYCKSRRVWHRLTAAER
jgi:hypothetical protein